MSDEQKENWYINSNKHRKKIHVGNWTPAEVMTPEKEIRRLKNIIENFLSCHTCDKDPDTCDYNYCATLKEYKI